MARRSEIIHQLGGEAGSKGVDAEITETRRAQCDSGDGAQ